MNKEAESIEVIEKRWDKKKEKVSHLREKIQGLRVNVSRDLKSENEKLFLTALVVAIMDFTSERVGNNESANNGHYGITGLQKKHIKINGNAITLEYVGKSGVEHTKTFTNEKLATALKRALKNSPSNNVFETSDGFEIKNDRVNRFLSDFGISAKDLRGFYANDLIIKRLNDIDVIEDTEYKRKRQFVKHMRFVAEKLGHGAGTLRKHYVLPEITENFILKGKIVDLDKLPKYERGGLIDVNIPKLSHTFINPMELLFHF